MNTKQFFDKYSNWFTDSSNDSRGVLGAMNKSASVPYAEFSEDVRSSSELNILVYYYHPDKPFFFGDPKLFPFTEDHGPGPEGKPYIIKRTTDWYCVPKSARVFDCLCFTVLKWNFEVTVVIFRRNFPDKVLGELKSKDEINEYLSVKVQGI